MPIIETSILQKAYTFDQYITHLNHLLLDNKTTGDNHSQEMLKYTKLNVQRMTRMYKTISPQQNIAPLLEKLAHTHYWILIKEAWCGDAGQSTGVIATLAQKTNINLHILLRDENLPLMDQFLTNGGRAIPILLVVDKITHQVQKHWGPRPAALQTQVIEWKKDTNLTHEHFLEQIHTWYTQDKSQSIQQELHQLFIS